MAFLILIFCYLFQVWVLRGFIRGLLYWQLNKSAYKKRKKGESLKERIMFSNFRDIIPRSLLIFFGIMSSVPIISLVVCLIFHFLNIFQELSDLIAELNFYFLLWLVILEAFFWSPSGKREYGRWINKRK